MEMRVILCTRFYCYVILCNVRQTSRQPDNKSYTSYGVVALLLSADVIAFSQTPEILANLRAPY